MKKKIKRKTVAQRITEGMRKLEAALESGKPLHELFAIRTLEIHDPKTYTARDVQATRHRLRVSQAVFAKMLGVSVELVEHWEQNVCALRLIARRLMDEINHAPDDFLVRHVGSRGAGFLKAG